MSPARTPAQVADALYAAQADLFWIPPWVRREEGPGLAWVASPEDRPPWNTVWAVPPEPARLPPLVEAVVTAHQGVTSRWLVAGRPPATLPERLAAAGYTPGAAAHAWVRSTEPLPGARPAWTVRSVSTAQDLVTYYEVARTAFGVRWTREARGQAWELALLRGPRPRLRLYLVEDPAGEAVASGALRLHPGLGLAYLLGGATLPAARGRGAYDALLRVRLAVARAAGLPAVGIYAQDATSGPIVARRGFTRDHPMTYWSRSPAP